MNQHWMTRWCRMSSLWCVFDNGKAYNTVGLQKITDVHCRLAYIYIDVQPICWCVCACPWCMCATAGVSVCVCLSHDLVVIKLLLHGWGQSIEITSPNSSCGVCLCVSVCAFVRTPRNSWMYQRVWLLAWIFNVLTSANITDTIQHFQSPSQSSEAPIKVASRANGFPELLNSPSRVGIFPPGWPLQTDVSLYVLELIYETGQSIRHWTSI